MCFSVRFVDSEGCWRSLFVANTRSFKRMGIRSGEAVLTRWDDCWPARSAECPVYRGGPIMPAAEWNSRPCQISYRGRQSFADIQPNGRMRVAQRDSRDGPNDLLAGKHSRTSTRPVLASNPRTQIARCLGRSVSTQTAERRFRRLLRFRWTPIKDRRIPFLLSLLHPRNLSNLRSLRLLLICDQYSDGAISLGDAMPECLGVIRP